MLNKGGNPVLDRKEAIERFTKVVEPILTNQGFIKLKGNSQIMFNPQTNSAVVVTSAPSQVRMYGDLKSKIRVLSKSYGVKEFFILYTREYSEWKDKEVYVSTMKRIMTIGRVKGVGSGIKNIIDFVNSVNRNESFWIGLN